MRTLRSLWRWITYKRVLIVFDGNYVSVGEMDWLQTQLYIRHIDAQLLRIDGYQTPLAVFALDDLKSTQFGWLKAELDKYAQPPMVVSDRDASADSFERFSRMAGSTRRDNPNVIDPKDLL